MLLVSFFPGKGDGKLIATTYLPIDDQFKPFLCFPEQEANVKPSIRQGKRQIVNVYDAKDLVFSKSDKDIVHLFGLTKVPENKIWQPYQEGDKGWDNIGEMPKGTRKAFLLNTGLPLLVTSPKGTGKMRIIADPMEDAYVLAEFTSQEEVRKFEHGVLYQDPFWQIFGHIRIYIAAFSSKGMLNSLAKTYFTPTVRTTVTIK